MSDAERAADLAAAVEVAAVRAAADRLQEDTWRGVGERVQGRVESSVGVVLALEVLLPLLVEMLRRRCKKFRPEPVEPRALARLKPAKIKEFWAAWRRRVRVKRREHLREQAKAMLAERGPARLALVDEIHEKMPSLAVADASAVADAALAEALALSDVELDFLLV